VGFLASLAGIFSAATRDRRDNVVSPQFLLLVFLGLVIGVLLAARRTPSLAEGLAIYVFAPSTFALAFVLFRSRFGRALLSWACVVADVSVVALFVLSTRLPMPPLTTLPKRLFVDAGAVLRSGPFLGMLAVLISCAQTAGFFPRSKAAKSLESWYLSQPRLTEAPFVVPGVVTLTEFVDYQCPPCKRAYRMQRAVIAAAEKDHPGQIQTRLLHFPLEPECNRAVDRELHPLACEAAAAVVMAKARNREPEMIDWLFEHQDGLSREALLEAARDVGRVENFEAGYAGALEQVKKDVEIAMRHDVRGTPAIFLEGVRLDRSEPAAFPEILSYALAGHRPRTLGAGE
jgi:hypothetical protein